MFSLMLLISLRNLERRLSICCLTFFLKWFTGSLKAAWSFAFILSIWFSRMIREVVLAKYWLKWLQKATQEMLLLPVVAVIVVVDDEIRTKLVLFAGLVLFQPLAVLLRTHSCFPEPKPNRKNVNRTTVIFVFSSFRKRGNKCPISYWAVDKSLMKHGKYVPQKADFFAMQCKNLSLHEGKRPIGSLVMLRYEKTPISFTFSSRLLKQCWKLTLTYIYITLHLTPQNLPYRNCNSQKYLTPQTITHNTNGKTNLNNIPNPGEATISIQPPQCLK